LVLAFAFTLFQFTSPIGTEILELRKKRQRVGRLDEVEFSIIAADDQVISAALFAH